QAEAAGLHGRGALGQHGLAGPDGGCRGAVQVEVITGHADRVQVHQRQRGRRRGRGLDRDLHSVLVQVGPYQLPEPVAGKPAEVGHRPPEPGHRAGDVEPGAAQPGIDVTRAVARLGRPVAYLGRLSGDRFGQLIRANLDQHGVKIAVEAPSAAPTTLAMVDLDPAGVPSYHFYLDGTSAAAVGSGDAMLPEGTT